MSYPFDPDWVVAPGETVQEFIEENGLTTRSLAIACGRMDVGTLVRVIAGEEPITDKIALGLERGTGIPKTLWLNLERAFRRGLAAGKTWTRPEGPPGIGELAGVAEVARILGCSRQWLNRLRERPDFPEPVAQLECGRIWLRADVEQWDKNHPRQPGRPPKQR